MMFRGTTCRCLAVATLSATVLSGCVSAKKYDLLQGHNEQLNSSLSSEIASNKVRITKLQNAVKVSVNSELLFPSGGWQMPPEAEQTIAKMAPILAPQIQDKITVNGYTDNTPIGPELQAQGVTTNLILSDKRANTVMQDLITQGVSPGMLAAQGFGDSNAVASNDTAEGRAQNRRVELTLAAPAT